MASSNRKSDFITEARNAIIVLQDALNNIRVLNREYTNNGSSSWLAQGDFTGTNSSIAKADFDTGFGNAATLDTYVSTQNYDDTFYKLF